jgi:hypothetical protein
VPFHRRVRIKLEPSVWAGYSFDAFYYPFGLSLLCKFRFPSKLALDKTVESCLEQRNAGYAHLGKEAPLDVVAESAIQQLRLEMFKDQKLTPIRNPEPFTVVTFAKGKGAESTKPADQKTVHRAIHSLGCWKPVRPKDTIPALALSDLKGAETGRVLYALPRSRVVWFPDLFTDSSPKRHSLACYHQNLTLASQQVEMLGALVRLTSDELRAGHEPKTETHKSCAKLSGGILGRLRGAVDSTYRSRSPAAQLKHAGLDEAVDFVRQELGET